LPRSEAMYYGHYYHLCCSIGINKLLKANRVRHIKSSSHYAPVRCIVRLTESTDDVHTSRMDPRCERRQMRFNKLNLSVSLRPHPSPSMSCLISAPNSTTLLTFFFVLRILFSQFSLPQLDTVLYRNMFISLCLFQHI